MDSEQQPDEFPTLTSAGELHDRGVLNVFCVENTLIPSCYWSEQFFAGNKTKKYPMSQRLIKTTGLEIELTKHTVFS